MLERSDMASLDVESADVLELIHTHLGPEWQKVTQDDLVISKISSGFVNRNYGIQRRGDDDGTKLLLKLYGGNVASDEDDICLSIEQEILTCDTWSRVGDGPKLKAVFRSGRMEEFIDSHLITTSEYQDPKIRAGLAQAMARFHSLSLPFRRPAFDYHRLLQRMFRDFVTNQRETIAENPVFRQMKVDIDRVAKYDFASDLSWLKDALQPEHHRMVFTHGDMHSHNILIRSHDSRPILIDFQESGYHWRARDLGLCLASSVFTMDFTVTSASRSFPSDEYCYAFFDEYMDEVERLAFLPDIDRVGRDSNEHLMMEALIGGMVSQMYVILLIMNHHQTMLTSAPELAVSMHLVTFTCH
jgi:thiamine kinase-like enzyme